MVSYEELKYRQQMPLNRKIRFTDAVIADWYESHKGQVYVAVSGGKDSTGLLHRIRSKYPEVPAVFCDTGLEFPEIREFVFNIPNLTVLKPIHSFYYVLKKWGYPVISKRQAMNISRYRNTKDPVVKQLRLRGGINPNTGKNETIGVISKKWKRLIDAPFKISDYCCVVMKKDPFKRYCNETSRKGFIGTMAADSDPRRIDYLQHGCNYYDAKYPISRPLSFWTETDIWEYIKTHNIPYCTIYDKGYTRTGCIFCAFGVHLERPPNRFQRLRQTHPKHYEYCMKKLGMREVLEYIGVPLEEGEQLELGNNTP